MAQTKEEDPKEVIKRLQARVIELEQRNTAQAEGKDETGTYGWTNLPQDEADRLRVEKQGHHFVSKPERDASERAWVARGGMDIQNPTGQVVVRDAATGKVLEGPAGEARPADGKPVAAGVTEESGDDRTIL